MNVGACPLESPQQIGVWLVLGVATTDRDHRDPRVHRVEEVLVLSGIAVARDDQHVGPQIGHGGEQFDLRLRPEVARHERGQSGPAGLHDNRSCAVGTCLRRR